MTAGTGDGVLAIMGSGETSPTMVGVHQSLVARLGAAHPAGVLLDTPYGFQENAGHVSARAQRYFATSVGLTVAVLSNVDTDDGLARLRGCDWLFAGPGSPSYALRRWRGQPVGQALRDRIGQRRGVTVLASAAAATAGRFTVPVYEIYKVGADPHWLDGLDVFGVLGLSVALVPHFDNAEGGNHDTRFCYLGERRLRLMERQLPADGAILGVDEHTAVVIDLVTSAVDVLGRGGLTVRCDGYGTRLPAGTATTIDGLRALIREIRTAATLPTSATAERPVDGIPRPGIPRQRIPASAMPGRWTDRPAGTAPTRVGSAARAARPAA